MNTVNFGQTQVAPSKLVCIGRNYVDHIKELDNEMPSEPVIFLKPNSAISEQLYLHEKDDIHYEAEITFMVKEGKMVAVGIGFDLTKRDVQSQLKVKGLPWERAKAFDRSAVFSQFVPFTEDTRGLILKVYINDELVQLASDELMIYKPNQLLEDIQQFMTLADGDLLLTGTPKGVGKLKLGDVFEAKLYHHERLLVAGTWSVLDFAN
ncbi:fumarylacetoacetate hydrolase family protein [Motilimonas eburnea]|uniref:fumarylacetoacetate hydrolase family protein n=1 Tax=Motilimonas eburnea TaxID=1737488 RepID=UPI001E59FA62|nr:fumarylacetoacetate hydrolase family protein [Motilimonas eburnea]MCE2573170.1 fumarylacetoacetate hydrolase family protein [Motilimonas eburnea]